MWCGKTNDIEWDSFYDSKLVRAQIKNRHSDSMQCFTNFVDGFEVLTCLQLV